MAEENLYVPENDPYFSDPYIDLKEWRDKPYRHLYIHGGFRGTTENGTEVRFSFYFPEKEKYEGRFYQYLSPAPENEHTNEYLHGEDDRLGFALTHGAYLVVSNQGGFQMNDPERLFRSSANTAQFSRKVAQKVYGYQHRPYGYCYGGSGGSFKTMGCMEHTKGVWDGAVPYVLANPMAAPNNFAPRVRVMHVLKEKGLERIVDNMEPGGSGNLYDGLTDEQAAVLRETTCMGFPKRAWFAHTFMGDGSLMVLAPYIYQICPEYFHDFWTKKGYAGADPSSPEAKDRYQFITTVKSLTPISRAKKQRGYNAGDSWLNSMDDSEATPLIKISDLPDEQADLFHCKVRVLNGKAEGKEAAIDTMQNGVIHISNPLAAEIHGDVFPGLAIGDQIMLDNSDYLAMMTIQRHQVPDRSFKVYDMYRNADGTPKYPQLPVLIAPSVAKNGGGAVPTGNIHGKMIVLCTVLDESAFPWAGDWYKKQVEKRLSERNNGTSPDNCFRLWFMDNCLHGETAEAVAGNRFCVDYNGMLNQALIDVAKWCEKGIAPHANVPYRIEEGQVILPDDIKERGGLQPAVRLEVENADNPACVQVKAGDKVALRATVEAAPNTGIVSGIAWDFENSGKFTPSDKWTASADGTKAVEEETHVFSKPGTYFPTVKAYTTSREKPDDLYTRCKNVSRVRVIVSE